MPKPPSPRGHPACPSRRADAAAAPPAFWKITTAMADCLPHWSGRQPAERCRRIQPIWWLNTCRENVGLYGSSWAPSSAVVPIPKLPLKSTGPAHQWTLRTEPYVPISTIHTYFKKMRWGRKFKKTVPATATCNLGNYRHCLVTHATLSRCSCQTPSSCQEIPAAD